MDRKKSSFIRIISWSVVAVLLTAVLVLGLLDKIKIPFAWIGLHSSYYYADAGKYQVGGAKIAGSDVKALDINWIDGSVKVEVYGGDTVQFFEESSEPLKENQKLHYYNKHGKLMIQYKQARRSLIFWGGNMSKELTVKIPEKTAEAMGLVKVDTVSSDTVIKGITADKIDLDSVTGSFKVAGCKTQKLLLDSTNGELTGDALTVEDVLDTDTVSGDVDVAGSIHRVDSQSISGSVAVTSKICPSKIETDTASGNVTLCIPENSGFTFKNDSVSNAVHSDFQMIYEKGGGTYKAGGADFSFASVSGDVSIRKLNKPQTVQ